ncbi:MoaF C-terminal domain-containing protein [Isoptericola sp. BMS4]|uniref:MoaF C-terminal domain-containing protein n=1 Tax=Isoptericola sp. BMS4 TaxID=2527875 RepID=UPI00141DFF3B|nr:MoaF C-terminal domain-containing protein [Isoptericola sp. BMS4]
MTTSARSPRAPEDQGFVPTDEWPDVTVMVDGFGEPSLPASEALEGPPIDVRFENGWTISHLFDQGEVTWTITEGDGAGATGTHEYRAVEVRPGIFFVDFVKGEGTRASDVSMILDRNDGKVTVADSSFRDRDGAVRMRTDILAGRVVGTGEIDGRDRTSALVGKRIYYRYSPTEHYEHVYLNSGTFVWHCVRGGEAGLADVDPIQVFELADDIVILHWSETVMPVESIVTIDLANKRSVGRMYCWDGPTLAPVHIPFDSRFTILSDTPYPEG